MKGLKKRMAVEMGTDLAECDQDDTQNDNDLRSYEQDSQLETTEGNDEV